VNLLFTVLCALPLGLLVGRRQVAVLAYLIVDSFLVTFQTLAVLLTWMSGGKGIGGGSGFGASPTGAFPIEYARGDVLAYGVVNLLITAAGVGLVLLGARLRSSRAGLDLTRVG
jgi:ABC-type xylose transport system permease subunit